MKVVVAGGSGFIGARVISKLIDAGFQVIALTRNKSIAASSNNPRFVIWDPRSAGDWESCVDGADAVINLSGENIAAKRWTRDQKEKIIQSRLESVKTLNLAIRKASVKPQVYVNASAVGYYGHAENLVSENSGNGTGFLAETCEQWERAVDSLQGAVPRVVKLRFGVVLGRQGGALQKMIPPFRFFVGGPLGSGKQGFPWIHIDDAASIVLYAVQTNEVSGPVNVVAPEILTMGDFCSVLGRVMHRPSIFPVPGFVLKILLGEMSDMLLTGQKVLPEKIQRAGYRFIYPTAEAAVKNLLL